MLAEAQWTQTQLPGGGLSQATAASVLGPGLHDLHPVAFPPHGHPTPKHVPHEHQAQEVPSAALTLPGWEVLAQPGPEARRAQSEQAACTTVSRPGGDGAALGSSTLVGAGCTWTRRKRVPRGCEARKHKAWSP